MLKFWCDVVYGTKQTSILERLIKAKNNSH